MYGLVLATTDQGSGAPPASARISAAEGKVGAWRSLFRADMRTHAPTRCGSWHSGTCPYARPWNIS